MGQYGWSGAETALGKTASSDIRRIIAAQYVNSDNNPIIGGGDVSGRADMAYGYAAGVGVMSVGDGAVMLTWPSGVTALVGPSPVARTDVVYCDQHGAIRVAAQGSVNESQVIVLRRMRTPAGMTATTQAVPIGDRNFALPYGAQLGWLAMHIEPYWQGQPVNGNHIDWVTLNFEVPTDRKCQIRMHQCIYGEHTAAAPSTDFTNFAVGSFEYEAHLDGVMFRKWEIGYSRIWEARMHNVDFDVNEGPHTLKVRRRWAWGQAKPLHFGDPANIWQPGSCGIHDEGVGE